MDILRTQNGLGNIYVRETRFCHGVVTNTMAVALEAGENLALEYESIRHGKLFRTYNISSVASYAIQRNDCPIAAIERAKRLGHKLVWINANAVSIHNGPRSETKHILVKIGMEIFFQGHFYEIVKAPNDNLALKEIA